MKPNAGDDGIGSWEGYFGQRPIIKDDGMDGMTEDPDYSHGYVINQRGVTKDLLRFLDAFYEKYPDQEERDLYIMGECLYFGVCVDALLGYCVPLMFDSIKFTHIYLSGESYAGKYVPSFARGIHERNKLARKGVVLEIVLLGKKAFYHVGQAN